MMRFLAIASPALFSVNDLKGTRRMNAAIAGFLGARENICVLNPLGRFRLLSFCPRLV